MTDADGVEVIVNADGFPEADVPLLEAAVRATLSAEGVEEGEISLTLLDDAGIQDLNARYLRKDRPTDVISFTLGAGDLLLGDVYLGVDQARRQAGDVAVTLREELTRLAVHGTLHVLGHDHPEGEERTESPMFALQERLVRQVLNTG